MPASSIGPISSETWCSTASHRPSSAARSPTVCRPMPPIGSMMPTPSGLDLLTNAEITHVNNTYSVLPVDPDTGEIGTTPFGAVDPNSTWGFIARRLSAGRVAAHQSVDPQLRPAVRSDVAIRQRQPAQPSRQSCLQAVGDGDDPRRLCALFHAAGAVNSGTDQRRTCSPTRPSNRKSRSPARCFPSTATSSMSAPLSSSSPASSSASIPITSSRATCSTTASSARPTC